MTNIGEMMMVTLYAALNAVVMTSRRKYMKPSSVWFIIGSVWSVVISGWQTNGSNP